MTVEVIRNNNRIFVILTDWKPCLSSPTVLLRQLKILASLILYRGCHAHVAVFLGSRYRINFVRFLPTRKLQSGRLTFFSSCLQWGTIFVVLGKTAVTIHLHSGQRYPGSLPGNEFRSYISCRHLFSGHIFSYAIGFFTNSPTSIDE